MSLQQEQYEAQRLMESGGGCGGGGCGGGGDGRAIAGEAGRCGDGGGGRQELRGSRAAQGIRKEGLARS